MGLGAGLAAFAWSAAAIAQLRWDLGAQAGASERVPVSGAPARTPGPLLELHADFAIYPMVRAGPYASFELSPVAGLDARRVYSGGLRARVAPPVLPAPWHAWAFIGFGVAYAYTPGSMGLRADGAVMPELPVGVGAGLKIRSGWELGVELGARVEVASLGKGSGSEAPPPSPVDVFPGDDLLAVSLTVGLNLEL